MRISYVLFSTNPTNLSLISLSRRQSLVNLGFVFCIRGSYFDTYIFGTVLEKKRYEQSYYSINNFTENFAVF